MTHKSQENLNAERQQINTKQSNDLWLALQTKPKQGKLE